MESKSCLNCNNGQGMICQADPYKCGDYALWIKIEDTQEQSIKTTGTTEQATHYMIGKQQPIEIMQSIMTPEQFVGFCLGNVIKYSLRLNSKNQMRSDAGKCNQYSQWLCEAMDGKIIIPGGK